MFLRENNSLHLLIYRKVCILLKIFIFRLHFTKMKPTNQSYSIVWFFQLCSFKLKFDNHNCFIWNSVDFCVFQQMLHSEFAQQNIILADSRKPTIAKAKHSKYFDVNTYTMCSTHFKVVAIIWYCNKTHEKKFGK